MKTLPLTKLPLIAIIGVGCAPGKSDVERTSLSGQVFAITQNQQTVKASGRTVTIVKPTIKLLRSADSTCAVYRAYEANISAKVPMSKYEEAKEFLQVAASGDVMGSAYSGESIATATVDLNGEFAIPDIEPGYFLAWAKTDYGEGRIYWLAYAPVQKGISNRAILGTDASEWQHMCDAFAAAKAKMIAPSSP